MNKGDLVKAISERTKISGAQVSACLAAMVGIVEEELSAGRVVGISKFGSFSARHREERSGRNPRTNEEIRIPAGFLPVFKPSKVLKDALR